MKSFGIDLDDYVCCMAKLLVLHDWKAGASDLGDKLYGMNKPTTRQKLILDRFFEEKAVGVAIVEPDGELTVEKLVALDVHSQEYLHFLENCYTSYESAPDTEMLREGGIVPFNFSRRKPYQSYTDVLLWRQIGYWCDDVITPIYKDTFAKALGAANICYSAGNYLDKYQYIYCLTGTPGHHAMRDGYGGYCYLNNAVICAKKLKGKKIALLDLDYHHGNGTQDISWNDPSFLSVSIHADPRYDYPSYSGFESENGPFRNNYNLIFEKEAKLDQYLVSLKKALGVIVSYGPDVLIVPFGADTLSSDPDASKLYRCGLLVDDFKIIGGVITDMFKGKIVITQEGGYDLANVPTAAYNFAMGVAKAFS